MQFYTKRRRIPVVPIISLIDILAILLIFFIVTTTFKEKKALLSIDLPQTKRLKVPTTSDNRVTIAVSREGEIFLDADTLTIDTLENALTRLKVESPQAKLELKADEKVELGLLVRIWDAIVGAGYKIRDVPARILVDSAGGGAE